MLITDVSGLHVGVGGYLINPHVEPLDVHLSLLPAVLASLQLDSETEFLHHLK